jgi:hypothetical protein
VICEDKVKIGPLSGIGTANAIYKLALDWSGRYKKLDLAGHQRFKQTSLIKGPFLVSVSDDEEHDYFWAL